MGRERGKFPTDANARRRLPPIPAPRARAGGAHAADLRRAAEQVHRLGGRAGPDGLESRRAAAPDVVPGHERKRALANQPKESTRRLSSESVYLEIAALRAFYRFAEGEKLLPANVAENLSLPRRWQRLPKALTSQEIEKLLTPETPETPHNLCDQAVLELLMPRACAWPSCAARAWSISISTPASSTSSAKATRSAWFRWAQSGGGLAAVH